MKVTIGREDSPQDMANVRRAQMMALSARAGVLPPPEAGALPRLGGAGIMKTGVGGPDCGPLGGCEQPVDPRVIATIAATNAGSIPAAPNGIDPNIWAAIVTYVQAQKYCPSPRRVGWQQSSITFQTGTAINSAAQATVTVTPGNAFCMNSLVAAAGTANDQAFTIDSFVYAGNEYVTNGPWYGPFYTAQAACCLCVKEVPVIDPNTSIVAKMTNQAAAGSAVLRFQIFGKELFCS